MADLNTIYAALGVYLKSSIIYDESGEVATQKFIERVGGDTGTAASYLSYLDGLAWDDFRSLISYGTITGNRWILPFDTEIKKGWENNAVLPHGRWDANRIEYQGQAQLPVSYFEWYTWLYGFSYRRSDDNWLDYPDDPTLMNQQLQYGPITLWDVDQMKQARAENRPLD